MKFSKYSLKNAYLEFYIKKDNNKKQANKKQLNKQKMIIPYEGNWKRN